MKSLDIVHEFYLHLANATGVHMQRGYRKHGYVWPAQMVGGVCVYHHVQIVAYVGDLEPASHSSRSAYARPIPRICVNHYDIGIPHPTARQIAQRFGGANPTRFQRHAARLELTVSLEQLVDFAPWIVRWTEARWLHSPSWLTLPPHAMEYRWLPSMFASSNLWTQAAADEYEAAPATKAMKRRHEQERQQRANRVPVGGTVAHGATGQIGGTTLPRAALRHTGQRGRDFQGCQSDRASRYLETSSAS